MPFMLFRSASMLYASALLLAWVLKSKLTVGRTILAALSISLLSGIGGVAIGFPAQARLFTVPQTPLQADEFNDVIVITLFLCLIIAVVVAIVPVLQAAKQWAFLRWLVVAIGLPVLLLELAAALVLLNLAGAKPRSGLVALPLTRSDTEYFDDVIHRTQRLVGVESATIDPGPTLVVRFRQDLDPAAVRKAAMDVGPAHPPGTARIIEERQQHFNFAALAVLLEAFLGAYAVSWCLTAGARQFTIPAASGALVVLAGVGIGIVSSFAAARVSSFTPAALFINTAIVAFAGLIGVGLPLLLEKRAPRALP
jgi:hypothetical protein